MNRVLVTGGAGCIGLEVCKQLRERGTDVRLFDLPEQILRVRDAIGSSIGVFSGSILDVSSLRDAMDGCDAVVHLAAMLGVRRTEQNRLRCLEVNVEGTKNVLECSIQNRLTRVVFASSSEVYGEPLSNPVDESASTRGDTVYAVSKAMGEELCKAFSQRYPWFSHVILRYFNTYGPYQTAQFVIPKFVSNVLAGDPPVVYGDGAQRRSYCYVSDLAWATVQALFREEAGRQVINVGNGGNPVSLRELADLVVSVAGKNGHIKPVTEPDFGQTDRSAEREIAHRFCDTRKAADLLGYGPRVSLEDGLRMLMDSGAIFDHWETTDLSYLQDAEV